ncbi:class I SAM-dependent methyltransferase [Bacillus sp. AK031]
MGNYLDFLALYGIGGAHPGGILLTKELLFREEIREDMEILDIGCGTGQTAVFIKEMFGSRVTALENHPIMVQKARKRFQSEGAEVELVEASADSMPFKHEKFDLITCESVLSFADRKAVLTEVKRVLKPGGLFLAVEMAVEKIPEARVIEELTNFYSVYDILSENEWKEAVRVAGFREIEIEKPDFPLLMAEPVIEFDLSEDISEEIHEMLDSHEDYLQKYNDILGVRIIKCRK